MKAKQWVRKYICTANFRVCKFTKHILIDNLVDIKRNYPQHTVFRIGSFLIMWKFRIGWRWIALWESWIVYNPIPRKVYVLTWERDCDMCETSGKRTFRSLHEYWVALNRAMEWREGPLSWKIVDAETYTIAECGFRDRTMEAYENGNGRSIYV